MTINEFNSKINLPAVCLAMGIKGFEFKKIPKFGWFAYTPDKSVILNLFQMLPEDQRPTKAYRMLTLDNTAYQETKMYYSEVSENKLRNNYLYTMAWNSFFKAARLEAKEGRIYLKGRKLKLSSLLEELGLPLLLENQIGLVNDRLYGLKEFGILNLKEEYKNKLIIPSYSTPLHPCSFEMVNPMDLSDRIPAFTNREKGWYGKLDHCIVSDLHELGARLGNTWDYKCDFWTTKPVDLSPTLNEEQCIKIWTEAKLSIFSKSPLDVILSNGKAEDIKNHVKNLNLVQIKELEQRLNVKLVDTWQKQQEEEITIGNTRFLKKNHRYYVERFGVEQEMTNFTLKINRIVREDGEYFHEGLAYFNSEEVAFKLPDAAFRSHTALANALRKLFLDIGLGLPIILSTYKHYLLNVVTRFNSDIVVDHTTLQT